MTKMNKRVFNLKEIIIIIVITSLFTSMTTGIIVYNQNKLSRNLTYKDLNDDENLKEFITVYASLIDQYYESVDKKSMLESAISAMLNYLGEDYSTYMSKEETDSLAERLIGEYQGIGITIDSEKKIVSMLDDSPAISSGLEIGDIILSVDDKNVEELTTTEVAKMITEKDIGEKTKIVVNRNGDNKTYEITSKKLILPVTSYNVTEKVGYLQITAFSNNLKEQVSNALKDMENQGINSLIIDLRDNTGGYLSAAHDVASMFLEKGKLIYSLEEKEETKDYKDKTDEKRDYKVVLLMNENSASSSEILIAALKESYGAITVGETSYGKGKVQQTYSLDDGSMVKYTSAKWLTPSGDCIDGKGITPDYEVYNTDENTDSQLNKAYEIAKE